MTKFHLLLAACLATSVLVAGCAADDQESTGDETGNELNQDVVVGDNGTMDDTTNGTGDANNSTVG